MTVSELIEQLQKVYEDAEVYLCESNTIKNVVVRTVLERDLADDKFVVVLKSS